MPIASAIVLIVFVVNIAPQVPLPVRLFREFVVAVDDHVLSKPADAEDAILCDLMMPEMSGIEAGKAIRRTEKERGVPLANQAKVIMLTSRNTPQDVMDAMMSAQSGAYLVKPLEPARLKETLSRLGLKLSK